MRSSLFSRLAYKPQASTYLPRYLQPGGEEILLAHLGKDISPIFARIHASDVLQKTIDSLGVVGLLSQKSVGVLEIVPAAEGEHEIEARRQGLPEPEYVINLGEFETMAKHVLGKDSRAWNFFSSYADDGASTSPGAQLGQPQL